MRTYCGLRTKRGLYCVVACILVAGPAERLIAQAPTPAAGQPTIRVPLFRQRDALIGLGVAALTVVTMSVDQSVARDLQRPSVQTNGGLKGTANVFNTIGFPGSAVFSASTYFFGLAKHSRPIASLGMHTGEAIVMGGVLAEGLQMTIGRARPQRDVNDNDDFVFRKGFTNDDYTSFPSTHTTVAFAAATAVSREVGRSWPAASKYVTQISYSVATLVGLSRMYKNKHWVSDVVGSAGLGIYSAVLFDRYRISHPDNVFERIFLPKSIVPREKGIILTWAVTK